MSVRTLLIDNYDSYTYNLYQMLAEVNGLEPIVIQNDSFGGDWSKVIEHFEFDNIVLSPGPGRPSRQQDFGLCKQAIEETDVPILGVCLGHQGLALHYGQEIVYAPKVMHGQLSTIRVRAQDPLFQHIPTEFQVVRYHSLVVKSPLRSELKLLALTSDDDQVIMAFRHFSKPHWGVQFHPESISTAYGYQMLQNFRNITREITIDIPCTLRHHHHRIGTEEPEMEPKIEDKRFHVLIQSLHEKDSQTIFDRCFSNDPYAFWLDSSNHNVSGATNARFSYLGDISGPLAERIDYDVVTSRIEIHRGSTLIESTEIDILDYVDEKLRAMQQITVERLDGQESPVPFDFLGGFVGYFGYELLGSQDAEQHLIEGIRLRKEAGLDVPDAALLFVDRFIVIDHVENVSYIVCVAPIKAEAIEWIESIRLQCSITKPMVVQSSIDDREPVTFYPTRLKDTYERNIDQILDEIHEGESYEICLTNQLIAPCTIEDPLSFYHTLRQVNPAPFSAFFRYGSTTICCSSPERFLRVDQDRWVESKPIKGTRRRGNAIEEDECIAKELAGCVKDRAENMMIVDLVRNDLGRVCEVGSVHVPSLMNVESYATVHQLVSTVRGRLKRENTLIDAVRATFPGGSMTGAPKKRSMKIIRQLERYPRGVYSGSLGFLSLNGAMDLNIVIRTAVISPNHVAIGSGGAVIALSETDEEYEEMLLKTRALVNAIGKFKTNRASVAPDECFFK